MDRMSVLKKVSVFNGLSPKEFDTISDLCQVRKYKKDEIIFTEKDKATEIFIVRQGLVRIELAIKGKTDFATVHRVRDGDFFGELSLAGEGKRSATARCEKDSVFIVIGRDPLLKIFNQSSRIGYVVMRNVASMLAARLRKTNLQLVACFLWE